MEPKVPVSCGSTVTGHRRFGSSSHARSSVTFSTCLPPSTFNSSYATPSDRVKSPL
ncbi:hypothetical protein AB0H43_29150 [Hamadaea sp. NPDC050747]|uniref:hypothetical protein n=1 Tax=Hamadaea sp. NPDC050747 TaxID=3155789 RepID=UPI0033E6CC4D